MSKPRKILVIALRYLGDVLLTTPLIRSLRQAYPDAQLDILLYANTVAMLEGNPDINQLICVPSKARFADNWALLRQLRRRYDLAITTQAGDRPFLYSLFAASQRIGIVPTKPNTGWWKRFFLYRWLEYDENTHTVLQHLNILALINVPPCFELVPPQTDDTQALNQLVGNSAYAVLHTHPQWTYKQWTIAGWIEIGLYLHELGLKLVLTGGTAQAEIDYVANIAKQLPEDTLNLAGRVSLAQLTHLLTNAALYIGVDTGITHLSAATNVPVIALYGPTNPVKWAPWPYCFEQNTNPFSKIGSQTVNNIHLLQGEKSCVPCHLEGCDKHQGSRSVCLDTLSPERVKATIRLILNK
ncbi:MAG: putative lipopolysaccharide heptosyltransferase III [Methylococcales bacterium]|nr:putative lipopolysaccharide heptosyltransferase III [Methylococcales bacterium]